MADDQAYLDELIAKRRAMAGVKRTTFSDQSTEFDVDGLNREIERVTRAVEGNSGTRYATTSKGLDN